LAVEQRKNIVSPLADALARASATPPPIQASAPPAQISASLRSDTPTIVPPKAPPPSPTNGAGFPPQSATQPDFSTLPPSIAASLARLAGTPLPADRTSGGPPKTDGASGEPKNASKVGSASG
jgi:hypothetical protein